MFLVRGGTVVVVGTLKVEFMSCLLDLLGVASLQPHKVEEALLRALKHGKSVASRAKEKDGQRRDETSTLSASLRSKECIGTVVKPRVHGHKLSLTPLTIKLEAAALET